MNFCRTNHKPLLWLFIALTTCASLKSHAIVVRHDISAAAYEAIAEEFPALVDLPGDGHGILIAPQWVITVAHGVEHLGSNFSVSIGGRAIAVSQVVVHPGYQSVPLELTTGNAAPLLRFLLARHDVALVRLATKLTNVRPVKLYSGSNEIGKLVTLFGKGSTGNGLTGQDPTSSNRNRLRRAQNVITTADGHWLSYRFDAPDSALPLEGMLGNGDSGGPVLTKDNGEWILLGVHAFRDGRGDLAEIRFSTYGTNGYQVRMSAYREWIDTTIKDAK